jgi:hypothetical protein
MSRAKDKSYNSRYDNEDDEVRYDEMGPNPQIQIHEQQQQLSQNLRHSEVPDKFLTKTRFQHRKSREQAQVEVLLNTSKDLMDRIPMKSFI